MTPTKIAIIGLGHWGPNYLRNFSQLDGCEVAACADMDGARIDAQRKNYPSTRFYRSVEELFQKESPDATVIATPTSTHYEIAKQALERGQHLLIEKPLALTEEECLDLAESAEKKKRVLMVGHTFLYNAAVNRLKSLLAQGEAGQLYYLHAERRNLGPIRHDVNALIDLAPHDISIYLYLLGQNPKAVAAHGASFLKADREDVTFVTLYFDHGIMGNIHVSWLDPVKTRQITVIGEKKMLVFDDINVLEPVRIYDKGVRPKEPADFSEFKSVVYDGDIWIPKIQMGEPLKTQCKAFLEHVQKDTRPFSDGRFGAAVTRVLVGAMQSLKNQGKIIPLH